MIISDLPRSHRKSAGEIAQFSCFSRELLARLRDVLGFISDSQSTPELWDPQESTLRISSGGRVVTHTHPPSLPKGKPKSSLLYLAPVFMKMENLISEAAEFGHFRV